MKISIIIPVYNTSQFLELCVESVLEQTFPDFEAVLVDDGSTDGSGRLCDELAGKDARIVVLHKDNGGLSSARNAGLDAARGEYVTFLDSDDMVSPDYLEDLFRVIEQNGAQIAMCGFQRFEKDVPQEPKSDAPFELITGRQAAMRQYCADGVIYVVACAKLYPRRYFQNVRFPVGRIHEDEAVTYRLLYRANTVAVLDERLYYYRKVTGSIMNSSFSPRRYDGVLALTEREDFYRQQGEKVLLAATSREKERLICKLFLQAKNAGKEGVVPTPYVRTPEKALKTIKGGVSEELYAWYYSVVYPGRAALRSSLRGYMKKIGKMIK